MFSDPVVLAVDVAEGFSSGLLDGFEEAPVEKFGLESGPEAFRLGIVIAIAFSAHRLPKPVHFQKLAKARRTVLAAPVRVDDRVFCDQTSHQSFIECLDHEIVRHSVRHLPARDPFAHLVLPAGQIAPLSICKGR